MKHSGPETSVSGHQFCSYFGADTITPISQDWNCGNNLLLQAMKLKIKKIQRKNQKPEFSKNPKIFKKQSIFPKIRGTHVFSIAFLNIFGFLENSDF